MLGLVVGVVAVLAVAYAVWLRRAAALQQEGPGGIPTFVGRLPWIGVGLEFAQDPCAYLLRLMRRVGKAVRVQVFGRQMVFFSDPQLAKVVLSHPDFSFKMATNRLMDAVFNLPPALFEGRHKAEDIASTMLMKGKYLDEMYDRMQQLMNACFAQLDVPPEGRDVAVRQLMDNIAYKCTAGTMFNEETVQGPEVLEAALDFDGYVGLLANGVPRWVLPGADRAWKKLAKYVYPNGIDRGDFHTQATRRRHEIYTTEFNGQAPLEEQTLRESQGLWAWASLTNTVPVAFWTLAHLAASPEAVRDAIRQELRAAREEHDGKLTRRALTTCEKLHSMIYEALRMYSSSFYMRQPVRDTVVSTPDGKESWQVRKGEEVFVPVYVMHHDPQRFANPSQYKWDRFANEDESTPALFPWGGGAHMCPGRLFATAEMMLIVASVVERWDVQPLDPLPEPSMQRDGLGVRPPKKDMRVRFVPRAKE